jgi:hypothetical protein
VMVSAERKDHEANMAAAIAASAALPLAGGFPAGPVHPAEGPEATGRSSLFLFCSYFVPAVHASVCCFVFCLLTSAHRGARYCSCSSSCLYFTLPLSVLVVHRVRISCS